MVHRSAAVGLDATQTFPLMSDAACTATFGKSLSSTARRGGCQRRSLGIPRVRSCPAKPRVNVASAQARVSRHARDLPPGHLDAAPASCCQDGVTGATTSSRDARLACDLLIVGGRVLDLRAESGVLDGAAIAIRDGVIVAVADRVDLEDSWIPARRIDAVGQVITPGFIDGHVHLAAYLGARRSYQRSTGPGLFCGGGRVEVVLPMVARMCSMPVPPDLVAAVARPALAAMLRAGFTGLVDAGSCGIDGLVTAATEVGIRAAIGPSLADLWHDERGVLVRQADPDVLLAEAEEAIGRLDGSGGGRVRAVVSAVETMACSDELLAGIAELTAQHDIPTHVHTHISQATVAAHQAAFGRTPTERLVESGMLSPRCRAMHAGFLIDEDIAVFAETGVTVNHNPIGNAMLGFGTTAAAPSRGC
jgi:5-methylthioadenosine/S-adenosylhomocysteine deaminase